MKKVRLGVVWLFALMSAGLAEPTESREWTATNGKKVEGKVLRVDGGTAVLERADGQQVKVPVKVFVAADRKLLDEHFQMEAGSGVESSGVAAAEGLAVEQGKVVGPIDTGAQASYFVYVPKSLKKERLAPLLFYTHSGGGSAKLIEGLKSGAETCGWVVAISVESRNQAPTANNARVSKAAVEHIIGTLPVDGKRVYFTGNSGGGAMAMINAAKMSAAGAMPNVAYMPQGTNPKGGHYYVLGGGKDYNRYSSAWIAKKHGKDGVHRMHPGGHGICPDWQRVDGMIWLNARYLEDHRRSHAEESLDFEAAVIAWIREMPGNEAHRAYSNARVLKDDYKISGANEVVLDALISELAANELNVRYHEGLLDLDELSEDKMGPIGETSGSKKKHTAPDVKRAAERLQEKYEGVPVIEDTLKALASPTVGG